MRYDGYLGELTKALEYNQITKEHPNYNLYQYIIETQKITKIKLIIKQELIKKIKEQEELVEKNLTTNAQATEIDHSFFSAMGIAIKQKYIEDYEIYMILNKIKSEPYFSSMVNNILSEVETRILDVENLRKYKQEKIEEIIKKQCTNSLKGIRINNIDIVENNNINKNAFKEIKKFLTGEQIKSLYALESIEYKKMDLYSQLEILLQVSKNIREMFDYLIIKVIKSIIIEKDKKIIEMLQKKENISSKNIMIRNKIYDEQKKEINVNILNLDDLTKINTDIFCELNIRCKLATLMAKINVPKNITDEIINKLSKKEQKNLNEQIKITFIESELENKSQEYFEEQLEKLYQEFILKKTKEYEKITEELGSLNITQGLYKTKEIKKLENNPSENNIYILYTPSLDYTITRLEAIYIYDVYLKLKKLENLDENDRIHEEEYKTLIEFLDNKKISLIPSRELQQIKNIIDEYYSKHYSEKFNEIINQKSEEIIQKKLILKKEDTNE